MTVTVQDPAFEALLDFLSRSRGFDFSSYKPQSLERRLRRRMDTVGCTSYAEYLDYIEVNPDEYEALFNTLLINVTEFFRDQASWEHLRDEALPQLLEHKADGEPIRIWSAGCSTGQEAYSVAMLLSDLLGMEEYRERVKVYATDIDEDALDYARHGTYTVKEAAGVPDALRERYFEPADQGLAFRKDLRSTVVFGRNNLVADAPISRLDLLLCRNTLMYLTAEAQARILRHFHFALRERGVLMLGKSEVMVANRDLFGPLDIKRRLFRKVPRPSRAAFASSDPSPAAGSAVEPAESVARDAALELGPQPLLIVGRRGLLSFANLPARALFGLSLEDLQRPFAELELSNAPLELRLGVEQALRDRRRVALGDVSIKPPRGDERRLDVTVIPLVTPANAVVGAAVTFEDITRYTRLQTELEANRRDLELAYEELQSTIDELETTNEELQSANEELQTTNEELQSTNEELETMNEELQSTNQELETINDELRDRTGELNRVNDFLENILTSLGVGVAVLDADQRVQIWNRQAQELWGMRDDEAAGRAFLTLDIGLPSDRLTEPLKSVLAGKSERHEIALAAVNRRGRRIECHTTVLPLISVRAGTDRVQGAIVLMESRADGA